MVVDLDDFGATHVISDMCQTNDCRKKLDELHYVNGAFKVTLFAVPGEMTAELCEWCRANNSWIELAVHGFYHRSNYECEKMTLVEFSEHMDFFKLMLDSYFTRGFKAPGWQIGKGAYDWLSHNGYWVADQSYNDYRRPDMPAYINDNGQFTVNGKPIESWHGHCWDCVGNGIYERFEELKEVVRNTTEFKFVSEVVNEG